MKQKSDPKNIGVAVIGLGRGMSHVKVMHAAQGAELLAVCDINKELVEKVAADYGCDAYTDYLEMAKRDDIDLISVCTPSGMHCDMAMELANAGKHVLSEKPLDINLERIDNTVKLFEEKGLQLGCIFQNRLAESNQLMKKAVEAGRLGKLTLATAHVKWYRDDAYYLKNGGWRGTWKLDGGGSLMNQSVHTIDLMQWMMGPVKSVVGVSNIWSHKIEAEDMGVALVKFESGAFGTVVGSTATYPGFGTALEIHGVDGGLCMRDNAIISWKLRDNTETEEDDMLAKFAGAKKKKTGSSDPNAIEGDTTFMQIQDMIYAVRDKRPPLIPGRDGRRAVEIILAIYKSAQSGQEVFLPL